MTGLLGGVSLLFVATVRQSIWSALGLKAYPVARTMLAATAKVTLSLFLIAAITSPVVPESRRLTAAIREGLAESAEEHKQTNSTLQIGLLDPIALMTRSMTTSVLPTVQK